MTSLLGFIEGIGGPELLMILFIILLLFGANRLPELARGMGKSIREFKKATAGIEDEIKRAIEEEDKPKPAIYTPPPAAPYVPPVSPYLPPAAAANLPPVPPAPPTPPPTPPPAGTPPPPDHPAPPAAT